MQANAIGGGASPTPNQSVTNKQTISQEDFIKLFLAQLQFQDPLEPVDNREFLAQLAQFSSLEQSRQVSQNTNDLLSMNAASQAVTLLNKQVEVQGLAVPFTGTVIAVSFTQSGPALSVRDGAGVVTPDIRLSQITLVKP